MSNFGLNSGPNPSGNFLSRLFTNWNTNPVKNNSLDNQVIPLSSLNDRFSSSNSDIQTVTINGQEYLVTLPSDEVVYNPEDKNNYLVRRNGNNISYKVINDRGNLYFPLSDKITEPEKNNSLANYLQQGDELFFDQNNGRYYVKRQGKDGLEEIDVNNLRNGNGVFGASPSYGTDVQSEVTRISSSGGLFEALGIPDGLSTSPVDVSGVVPGFGDQTGATIAACMYVEAGLYTQMQKTLNIINYLNTAPNGIKPNNNFSYIQGRPPYGQDTPEGRREQDKVFAALRTNIIAQLTRIAEQLRDTIAGLRTQKSAAESYKTSQDSEVKKWTDAATKANG
jgi:hypothetical protein